MTMPEGTPTDETDPTEEAPETPETETDADNPEGRKMPRDQRMRLERNAAREALSAAEARITAYQTREVERLASELAQPSDLFGVGGVSLADLLDAAGDVDSAAVAEAVAAVLASRPRLRKVLPPRGATDPSQALSNGRVNRQPTFADMLK